jgi:class 3 adenylate cyclase
VLFSDLVVSTEIAAHLDAEDWREIAAQYQRNAAAAVTRFGGHVAKYLGDGLMVYFGWPQAHEDDAERAVRAGLAIVDEVAALNGGLATEHRVRLSVRVGIQTGSVVMGHGGDEGPVCSATRPTLPPACSRPPNPIRC